MIIIVYLFAALNLPSRKVIFPYVHEGCPTKRPEIQNTIPCCCDFAAVFSESITVIDKLAFVGVTNSFEKTTPLCCDKSIRRPLIFTTNFGSYKNRADSISVIAAASGRCLSTKALILVPCPDFLFVVCLSILNGESPLDTTIS